MDIFIKAKELGEMLLDSPEMKRYSAAQDALNSSHEAKELINRYNEKQAELSRLIRAGLFKEDRESKEAELRDEFKKLNEHPIVREYLEASEEVDKLIKWVNDIISYTISGKLCSPSKCGSCSGCCKH